MSTDNYPGTPQHQALLKGIVQHYAADPRIRAVMVFGSLGRGNWDTDSDIDLDVIIADGAMAVVIGIVDDGVQHTHPDLAANYNAGLSIDINDNDSDPSPGPLDDHGTAVAGVAAAVGDSMGPERAVAAFGTITFFFGIGQAMFLTEYPVVAFGLIDYSALATGNAANYTDMTDELTETTDMTDESTTTATATGP